MDKSDKTDKSEKQEKPKKTERIKFFKNLVGNLKMNVPGSKIPDITIEEPYFKDDFEYCEAIRYGFPDDPRSIAFDPYRRLLAVGNSQGQVKLFGKPGVETIIELKSKCPVNFLVFLMHKPFLISFTSDGVVHEYDVEEKYEPRTSKPLSLSPSETITYVYQPVGYRYIYVGTSRGNVKIIGTNALDISKISDVMWNKAIDLNCKTNPGSVVHISEVPADTAKLLVAYQLGLILVWDLKDKRADNRIYQKSGITSCSWHNEGKQFLVSHTDGSISTWAPKAVRPNSIVFPHAKVVYDNLQPECCKPIHKIQWKTCKNSSDSFIIFSGGLPENTDIGKSPANLIQNSVQSTTKVIDHMIKNKSELEIAGCLTIIHGKKTFLLEFEYPIIDFIVCCEKFFEVETNEPYAVVILLTEDIVVVDLTADNFPVYRNIHTSLLLHQSPITSTLYFCDISLNLNSVLHQMGMKCKAIQLNNQPSVKTTPICSTREVTFTNKDWPINSGECSTKVSDFADLIITGHGDGSIKFWDVSSSGLHLILRLDCSKYFEKVNTLKKQKSNTKTNNEHDIDPEDSRKIAYESFKNTTEYSNYQLRKVLPGVLGPVTELYPDIETPLAIEHICFTQDGSVLLVSTSNSTIIFFKQDKAKVQAEVTSIKVEMSFDQNSNKEEPSQQAVHLSNLSDKNNFNRENIILKENLSYCLKKEIVEVEGFQAKLVIFTPQPNVNYIPPKITALSYVTSHDLIAYGSEFGIYIVDTLQKQLIFRMSAKDIYGVSDPFQRSTSRASDTRNTDSENRASNDQKNLNKDITQEQKTLKMILKELVEQEQNKLNKIIADRSPEEIDDQYYTELSQNEDAQNKLIEEVEKECNTYQFSMNPVYNDVYQLSKMKLLKFKLKYINTAKKSNSIGYKFLFKLNKIEKDLFKIFSTYYLNIPPKEVLEVKHKLSIENDQIEQKDYDDVIDVFLEKMYGFVSSENLSDRRFSSEILKTIKNPNLRPTYNIDMMKKKDFPVLPWCPIKNEPGNCLLPESMQRRKKISHVFGSTLYDDICQCNLSFYVVKDSEFIHENGYLKTLKKVLIDYNFEQANLSKHISGEPYEPMPKDNLIYSYKKNIKELFEKNYEEIKKQPKKIIVYHYKKKFKKSRSKKSIEESISERTIPERRLSGQRISVQGSPTLDTLEKTIAERKLSRRRTSTQSQGSPLISEKNASLQESSVQLRSAQRSPQISDRRLSLQPFFEEISSQLSPLKNVIKKTLSAQETLIQKSPEQRTSAQKSPALRRLSQGSPVLRTSAQKSPALRRLSQGSPVLRTSAHGSPVLRTSADGSPVFRKSIQGSPAVTKKRTSVQDILAQVTSEQETSEEDTSEENRKQNGFCQSPTNIISPLSNNQSSAISNSNSTSSANQGQHFIANSAQSTPQHSHHQHVLTSQQSFCYSNLNKRIVHLTKEAVNTSASGSNYSSSNTTCNTSSKSNNKRMLRMQSMCSLTDDQQAKSFFNLSVGSTSEKVETLSTSSSNFSFDRNEKNEHITSIVFCDSFYNKYETSASLTLWVGTNFGTVTAFPVTVPEKENRETCLDVYQVKPPEIMHNLKSSIVHISFLDLANIKKTKSLMNCLNYNSEGNISPLVLNSRQLSQSNVQNISCNQNVQNNPNSPNASSQQANSNLVSSVANISPTTQQLLVIVSEKTALVILLPTHKIFGRAMLNSIAKHANVVYIKNKNAYCLNVFLSNNQICIYSLPSLKLINQEMTLESNNLNDLHVKFSTDGFGIYSPTRSEISKFCVNKNRVEELQKLKPIIFKDKSETGPPDPPKGSAIRSFLFKETDKMDLFGFNKASPKLVLRPTITSKTNLPNVESARSSLTSKGEFSKLKKDFVERGENIEILKDAAERLQNEASQYRENSHNLVKKYEKKNFFSFNI